MRLTRLSRLPSPRSPPRRLRERNLRRAKSSVKFSGGTESSEPDHASGPPFDREFALEAPRQHGEHRAEDEEQGGHEGVPLRGEPEPLLVFQSLLQRSQNIEETHDRDQGRVLEEIDPGIDDGRQGNPQSLRPDDQKPRLERRETEREGRLVLAERDRLQTASDRLRHVGRREQRERRRHTGELVEVDAPRQHERQDHDPEEQDRHYRRRAPKLDERDARAGDLRMAGSAPVREEEAEGNGNDHGDERKDKIEEEPTPEPGFDEAQTEDASVQEQESCGRENDEEREHRDPPPRIGGPGGEADESEKGQSRKIRPPRL